jgi:2-alkyl-3-oxoalkanoate reductase
VGRRSQGLPAGLSHRTPQNVNDDKANDPALGPVLVTGGTGFLGRAIVDRLLSQGRPVAVAARTPAPDLQARGVRFIRVSLDDAVGVREACRGMRAVFHVAAKVGVWGRRADFFRANVLGTRAVIDGCRIHGVGRLIHTSTPSVVYNGRDLAGVDESLPLTTRCPSYYPLTKAAAEAEILAAHGPALRTVALRPHLIWGPGDPHLVPRLLARARAGRLRIVGEGRNRVDMVHVENAADAHIAAERCLAGDAPAGGKAYFITNGEPVVLWDWINGLLAALGEAPVTRRISLRAATALGFACEAAWSLLPLPSDPPMTRFVAAELAKDHWFDISAARRDLGYAPRVGMEQGTSELVRSLRSG